MEQQHIPSQQFNNKIVYSAKHHQIPLQFIFNKLSISSFKELLQYKHITNLTQYLRHILHELQQHQMQTYLQDKDIDLQHLLSIFRTFQQQSMALIDQHPFYLGIDKTYMQQLKGGQEVVIDHEREFSLKWTKIVEGGKIQFVKLYKFQELVIIGESLFGSKDYTAIKLYNNELYLAIEMGLWRQNFPLINLTIKYEEGKRKIYCREFEGRKLKRGQIRFIDNSEINVYIEDCNENLGLSAK